MKKLLFISILIFTVQNLIAGYSSNNNSEIHTFIGSAQMDQSVGESEIDTAIGSYSPEDISYDDKLISNPLFKSKSGNRPPQFLTIEEQFVNENEAIMFYISDYAFDPDYDPLTFSHGALPNGASFISAINALSWCPDYTQSGIYDISFTASDGDLVTSTDVYINVVNVNRPPEITSGPTADPDVIDENQTSSISVQAVDIDGDGLTYAWSASIGNIIGSGATVEFSPPDITKVTNVIITVTVEDSHGLTVSGSVTVEVQPVDIEEQTPWQTYNDGAILTDLSWNYTMGYHFTPNVNGQITKLGGFFNGTKNVFLWKKSTGDLLAQCSVTSSNNWSYTGINPVSVTAGETYTVAAYLDGSGASYSYGITFFPRQCGVITIESSTFIYGQGRPVNMIVSEMYGQVDIAFVQQINPNNQDPVITSNPVIEAYCNSIYNYDVEAYDPDGDLLTYSLSEAPVNMSIDPHSGVITYMPGNIDAGTYQVVVEVSDVNCSITTQSYQLTVLSQNPFSYTPWQLGQLFDSGQVYTDVTYNYTMGYDFTPRVDGRITGLGGFFNGTKTAYLWEKDTGNLIASIQVTANNTWEYANIGPVNVDAGKTYTVAVYLAGSGGSYKVLENNLPRIFGDITIERSVYINGNGRPIHESAINMFGQADIIFESR